MPRRRTPTTMAEIDPSRTLSAAPESKRRAEGPWPNPGTSHRLIRRPVARQAWLSDPDLWVKSSPLMGEGLEGGEDRRYRGTPEAGNGGRSRHQPRALCGITPTPTRPLKGAGVPCRQEALALYARFRGHNEGSRITHATFCNEVLGPDARGGSQAIPVTCPPFKPEAGPGSPFARRRRICLSAEFPTGSKAENDGKCGGRLFAAASAARAQAGVAHGGQTLRPSCR
jgi:hypothetical protein